MKKGVLLSFLLILLLPLAFASTGKITDGTGLQITEVTTTVNGAREISLDYGDTISASAKPGSVVFIDVELSNLLILEDIKDVAITTSLDLVGKSVFERTSESFLLTQNRKIVRVMVPIPIEAEEGKYRIEIIADGRGAIDPRQQEVHFTLFLDVVKSESDLIVSRSDVEPSSVECGENVIVSTWITNIGRKLHEQVHVELVSVPLRVFKEDYVTIDSGSFTKQSFAFTVPDEIDEGDYKLFTTITDGTTLKSSATLHVKCEAEKKESNKMVEEETSLIVVSGASAQPSSKESKSSGSLFGDSYLFTLILFLIAVTLLLIVIALAML